MKAAHTCGRRLAGYGVVLSSRDHGNWGQSWGPTAELKLETKELLAKVNYSFANQFFDVSYNFWAKM